MRVRTGAMAALLLALASAGSATANTTDRFSFIDVWTDTYSCGAVVTTRVEAEGAALLAADGTWLFTLMRYTYDGTTVDPTTGAQVSLTGRQIVTERPDAAFSRGQGSFVRVGGEGVVLLDVGRLVFDPADGSTVSASAQVVRFDDPEAEARIDAAICSLLD